MSSWEDLCLSQLLLAQGFLAPVVLLLGQGAGWGRGTLAADLEHWHPHPGRPSGRKTGRPFPTGAVGPTGCSSPGAIHVVLPWGSLSGFRKALSISRRGGQQQPRCASSAPLRIYPPILEDRYGKRIPPALPNFLAMATSFLKREGCCGVSGFPLFSPI